MDLQPRGASFLYHCDDFKSQKHKVYIQLRTTHISCWDCLFVWVLALGLGYFKHQVVSPWRNHLATPISRVLFALI